MSILEELAAPITATEKVASDPSESRAAYIERSKSEGLLVTFPSDCELQIDIDNAAHRAVFDRSYEIFKREMVDHVGSYRVQETVSKSGTGAHIRITLPFKVDVWQRIAWQAALGSDPVREVLSCFRARRGDTEPTLLAEKPGYDET